MIQQICGYIAVSSLNSSSTLKIRLSVIQSKADFQEKQILLSSAVKVFKLSFIVVVIFIATICIFSSYFFKTSPNLLPIIITAFIVSAISLIIEQYGSIAGNALRGNNLDFKGIGIRSFGLIISYLFTVLFLYLGFSLVGMALASLSNSIIFAYLWNRIAKKELIWYKIVKVSWNQISTFTQQSLLTTSTSIGGLLLTASESIILGILLTPKMAGNYFLTVTLIRLLVLPLTMMLLTSSYSGFAYLKGKNEDKKLLHVQKSMQKIIIGTFSISGMIFIYFNKFFIYHWVGEKFYLSNNLEFVYLILAFLQYLYMQSQYALDLNQVFKKKSLISLITGFVYVAFSIILVQHFNVIGIIYSGILARLMNVILTIIIIPKAKMNILIPGTYLSIGIFLSTIVLATLTENFCVNNKLLIKVCILLITISFWLFYLFPIIKEEIFCKLIDFFKSSIHFIKLPKI
jgi:O-antigen/teichoic acid export membrane protein